MIGEWAMKVIDAQPKVGVTPVTDISEILNCQQDKVHILRPGQPRFPASSLGDGWEDWGLDWIEFEKQHNPWLVAGLITVSIVIVMAAIMLPLVLR